MLLAADIGNTQTVIGLIRNRSIMKSWRLTTNRAGTRDELWISIRLLCDDAGIDIRDISRIIVSSVVPAVNDTWHSMSTEYLKTVPLFVNADLQFPRSFLDGKYRSLGADRICNIIAGLEAFTGPQIIIDLGTATTYDIINPKGKYIGGAIAPGIKTSYANLVSAAAQLHGIPLAFPESPVGKDTLTQLQSGILWGAVDQIDGMIKRIRNEANYEYPSVLATGGLAAIVAEKSAYITTTDPDLTLKGLALIADYFMPEQK